MALWGNNDSIRGGGTVTLDYQTGAVTGTATTFGDDGAIQEGDIIRFGNRLGVGTFFGDAVVTSIASTVSLTIGSTAGLGGGLASTTYTASQLPKFSVLDSKYSKNTGYAVTDSYVYGVADAGTDHNTTSYKLAHGGWVGVTTYIDAAGNYRVKSETLVAMSGITTGNAPGFPPGPTYGGTDS
jgi:hypothetical protein|tara:strand:- start:537 stop:1085 length:549 start_codon:yes stop_codon:yes gene_type:complete